MGGFQKPMKLYAILCAYGNVLIFLDGGVLHGFHNCEKGGFYPENFKNKCL